VEALLSKAQIDPAPVERELRDHFSALFTLILTGE